MKKLYHYAKGIIRDFGIKVKLRFTKNQNFGEKHMDQTILTQDDIRLLFETQKPNSSKR